MKNQRINYSAIIKEARLSKGVSQEVLAERVGVRKTTISNYETGYSSPSPEITRKIACALDMSYNDMLTIGMENPLDLNLPRTFQGVNDVFIPYIRPENISVNTMENHTYMDSYITLPKFMLSSDGNYVCIKAKDNSMSFEGINNNDYVFVRKSCNISQNMLVLAINIETGDYVIRKYRREDHDILLVPSCNDSEYSIITYSEDYPQYKIIGYIEKILLNVK